MNISIALASFMLLSSTFFSGCAEHQKKSKEPTALEYWQSGSQNTIAWLETQQPLVQIAAFQEIVGADPTAVSALCSAPQLSGIKSQCKFLENRPHLIVKPSQVNQGQHHRTIDNQQAQSPLWEIAAVKTTGCTPELNLICLSEKAAITAPDQVEQTAAYCNSLSTHLRAECYFYAADQLKAQPKTLERQLELCFAAAPYADRCLSHMRDQIVDPLPGVHQMTSEHINHLTQIHTILSSLSEPWQKYFAAQLWSSSTLFILEHSQPTCSAPLNQLPEELKPYWQSALVYLNYQKQSVPVTPEERFERIKQWSNQACNRSFHRDAEPIIATHYWPLGNETSHTHQMEQRIPYLKNTYRVYSTDPYIESELLWLETAAQHNDWDIVQDFSSSPTPVIQKRAAQLISHRQRSTDERK